jgi:hypothetical protein
MGDSHSSKLGTRPGGSPSPAKPAADNSRTPIPGAKPAAPDSAGNSAGRIVHDERGNAVWDWLKDTARIAIDSTSRLLRKLEVPDLKIEDTQSHELRVESDRDIGGGYDPYGGAAPTSGRASGKSGGGHDHYGGRGSSPGRGGAPAPKDVGGGYDPYGRSSGQSSGPDKNGGGGYDPYGKGVTNKPKR